MANVSFSAAGDTLYAYLAGEIDHDAAQHLRLCLDRYGGDVATAAAAYHSGWGTVDGLLAHEDYTGDGKTLPSFPYSRMNHYVEKILRCYDRYTELYGPSI